MSRKRWLPKWSSVSVVLMFLLCPLQVELHVHLDGSIKLETILYYAK